jgi:hypothetical protein
MDKVEELAANIGLPIEELQNLIKKDEWCISHLVIQGHTREDAELLVFTEDLENVLEMMREHKFSARTTINFYMQTPDFWATEDENTTDSENSSNSTSRNRSSSRSSCSNRYRSRSSSTGNSSSSTDEEVQAKRMRLDPDHVPETSLEGTSIPAMGTHS